MHVDDVHGIVPAQYIHSPALIRSIDAMKCLLDAMLVLTKQDRLCHVIHATSDPFYQTWLRQLNVMQHCKVRTFPSLGRSVPQPIILGADHYHRRLSQVGDTEILPRAHLAQCSRSAASWSRFRQVVRSLWWEARTLAGLCHGLWRVTIAIARGGRADDMPLYSVNSNGRLDSKRICCAGQR